MEILSPSPPPSPAANQFLYGGGPLHAGLRRDHAHALLHIAVGRSPEKTLPLLRWAFRRFACARIVLLHVHQPSHAIPTLLGKIPAAQATEELVLSHGKSEKDEMNKILFTYLTFCRRAQVQASLLVTESDQIHNGIVTLARDHGVTKLVMGSIPDNCFKLKASHNKEYFMAKNAPAFCEIWFVWGGRHIWTREASAAIENSISVYSQDDTMMTIRRTRFTSNSNDAGSIVDEGYITCGTSTEMLDTNLKQVIIEAEVSRKEAFVELLKRKETELNVASAFARVKVSESSRKLEMKTKEELEGLFLATRKQHEDLARSRENATTVLDSSMRRLDILDARAKSISQRMNDAVVELEVIQSSIKILKQEKTEVRKLEDRHINQIDEGCTCSHYKLPNCSSVSLGDDSYTLRQLTLLDMQAATCKFSESFKIRPRVHGCVYKGEIMNRGVMIHKLHSHSIKSLMLFQQEVCILNKVRHPHLVTFVGACPDALCLVYEYLQNGSLHGCLFRENNTLPLPWKIRARIVAEISSALLFLHSCKPQMMVHGGLNLENVLLDTDFHCKIADFGISTDDSAGLLPHKSDLYSFGTVILQLLTGKHPGIGLASEVRRAMSCGKLYSILDPTAGEWPREVA